MSLIHILNNYHDPFPHIKGRGGLQFHPSRRMIGGALSNEVAIRNMLSEVENTEIAQPITDTTEDDEIRERLAQYEQPQLQQQASEPEPTPEYSLTDIISNVMPLLTEVIDNYNNPDVITGTHSIYTRSSLTEKINKIIKEKYITDKSELELLNKWKESKADSKTKKKSVQKLVDILKNYQGKKDQLIKMKIPKPTNPTEVVFNDIYNLYSEFLLYYKLRKNEDILKAFKDGSLSKMLEDFRSKNKSDYHNALDHLMKEKYISLPLNQKMELMGMLAESIVEQDINRIKKEIAKKKASKALEISTDLEVDEMQKEFEAKQAKEKKEEGELITKFGKYKGEIPEKLYGKAMKYYNGHGTLGHYKAQMEKYVESLKLKPETLSLPEPDIEKALVKVENPKIVKMIDDALDQLIEGLITKSARDTIDRMDKLFTDISVVKGHGKSFENILCNTDFKYVLQSITGSQTPILNNDENPKLKGHIAKYKIQGQSLPLGSVCVYDLYDEKASYECKNYFGTKTWGGENYYGNTTGITMQTDKFEGNYNFKPYFNKVNGQWKLYNVLVEYSHDLNEEGKPKNKWLYKNYNTDLIFIVLCKDALVYYNLTDDLETYAYKINTKGYEGKNKEELYEITISDTIKLGVVNPKKDGEIFIPTNKFKPIIPI